MRRVVVDMENTMFSDAIALVLRGFDSDFDVFCSESSDKTIDICDYTLANILIMEVTNETPCKYEERMKVRDAIKKINPMCKIVLVVNENTENKLATNVRQAKKKGLIDDFVYSSVSATYLSAVIDTL